MQLPIARAARRRLYPSAPRFRIVEECRSLLVVDDLGATLAFYQRKLGSTFFISVVVTETGMTTSPSWDATR